MKIGNETADEFFREARYVVAMGSNDFINDYLLPLYSDSWTYNGDTFLTYLMSTLDAQLKVRLQNFLDHIFDWVFLIL